MNKYLFTVFVLVVGLVGFLVLVPSSKTYITSPLQKEEKQKERSLDKYTIDALSRTDLAESKISLGEVLKEESEFTSYKFYFFVENKKVSGLLNIPHKLGQYPIIVMFRGYVDREIYETGVGTQRTGEVFAKNGFITLAPDFLGYGESDNPSDNSIEERFQTYVTALTLLASVENLNSAFSTRNERCHSELDSESSQNQTLKQVFDRESQKILAQTESVQGDDECTVVGNIVAKADTSKVGIWGHSNGGQIALSVLEITGQPIPTVLWAPVSKPFPYSVLYYTDEFEDRGKMLRRVIADFEADYDVELYNLTNFFERINAPLQIHQGTNDDAIPQKWSDQLVEELEKLKKDAEYFTYSGVDHNLLPTGWNSAVNRTVEFYKQRL